MIWKIERGGLDDLCTECGGDGVVVTSPCEWREPGRVPFCERETGCPECRRRCPTCRGRGMPNAPVHAEDFGDQASLDIAKRAFPGIAASVSQRRRIDMDASALG